MSKLTDVQTIRQSKRQAGRKIISRWAVLSAAVRRAHVDGSFYSGEEYHEWSGTLFYKSPQRKRTKHAQNIPRFPQET